MSDNEQDFDLALPENINQPEMTEAHIEAIRASMLAYIQEMQGTLSQYQSVTDRAIAAFDYDAITSEGQATEIIFGGLAMDKFLSQEDAENFNERSSAILDNNDMDDQERFAQLHTLILEYEDKMSAEHYFASAFESLENIEEFVVSDGWEENPLHMLEGLSDADVLNTVQRLSIEENRDLETPSNMRTFLNDIRENPQILDQDFGAEKAGALVFITGELEGIQAMFSEMHVTLGNLTISLGDAAHGAEGNAEALFADSALQDEIMQQYEELAGRLKNAGDNFTAEMHNLGVGDIFLNHANEADSDVGAQPVAPENSSTSAGPQTLGSSM